MESLITIGTFVQHLTYYLKVVIYANKGTDQDIILEKCIKLYNKYKTIEESENISESDEALIRKCLKRLNLILKIDQHGLPINIRQKEHQLKMIYLSEHSSLYNDNRDEMVMYATNNKIDILTDIPLVFALHEGKYNMLLWQYTRSLFYISQILLTKTNPDDNLADQLVTKKRTVFDEAALQLETIFEKIKEAEDTLKINQVMALDNFLNTKLIKSGITDDKVNTAKNEVKSIFKKKGISNDPTMNRMIDSISEKLTSLDFENGNVVQSMMSIAKDVAGEMKDELQGDPENFKGTLSKITEVFKETLDDSSSGENKIPDEFKSLFNKIMSTNVDNMESGGELNETEILSTLENFIQENNINRDELFNSIKDTDGEIDVSKLEDYLKNLNTNSNLLEHNTQS